MIAPAFLSGLLTWTLLEYGIHRLAGHVWPKNPFGDEHVRHHREAGYFAPGWKKALIAFVVLGGLTILATPLVGLAPAAAWSSGISSAYLGYEWFHRQIHVAPPRTALGRWARRHHLAHHHKDPRVNHGVTSPLWDVVFGTYVPAARVRIVRRKAAAWMLEPGRPWSEDYELVGRPVSREA